jgi:hypothetical protein
MNQCCAGMVIGQKQSGRGDEEDIDQCFLVGIMLDALP